MKKGKGSTEREGKKDKQSKRDKKKRYQRQSHEFWAPISIRYIMYVQ